MYDVIIIGGGAAGMAAAVYTCRKKLKTVIITIDIGGQTNLTAHIENYPGVDTQHGYSLMKKFKEQAIKAGSELINGKAVKVEKIDKNFKVILSNNQEYETKAIILALGKVPNTLGIHGEEKFIGKGVTITSAFDAINYKNKEVAVVGGGNSALEATLDLSEYAKKVYLIHRRDKLRGDEVTVDKLKQKNNVEFVLNHVPIEISGNEYPELLKIENIENKEPKEIKISSVFVEIGLRVDSTLVKHLVKTNEKNEVITDERCQTSQPGIFAAGDITQTPYKQTIVSAGEGVKAALEVHKYITGRQNIIIDWDH